ncbi:MAG: twin-arginine translocase TatA/TatE family subunit [Opitutaceae bacterium]|nr:twin-arginine translocase TatA/TatE family subunit [Opitutaceae bacterium]
MFGLGGPELVLILVILLLLFGAAKLPALAKGLGQSIREFKKAAGEGQDADTKSSEPKKPEQTNGKPPGPN